MRRTIGPDPMVRRPGGSTRETCIQVHGHKAAGLFICPGHGSGRQAGQPKAAAELASASASTEASTEAWPEMAAA